LKKAELMISGLGVSKVCKGGLHQEVGARKPQPLAGSSIGFKDMTCINGTSNKLALVGFFIYFFLKIYINYNNRALALLYQELLISIRR
jgi:hypothetical protein